MTYQEFVKSSIMSLNTESFESLKSIVVGEYLSFSIIDEATVSMEILSEKACGYFEKLELKTGKSFDRMVETYIDNIDSIVSRRIAKTPQPKKKDPTPIIVPRARKYYEKALTSKNSRTLSFRNLVDYTRIMMCLYMEIINQKYSEISSLDYSADCLNIDRIIESMKNERATLTMNVTKKKRFDIKELYCSDTCTFIIAIILLFVIMDGKVTGEYYHG